MRFLFSVYNKFKKYVVRPQAGLKFVDTYSNQNPNLVHSGHILTFSVIGTGLVI